MNDDYRDRNGECARARADLARFLDGELDLADRERIEAHLAACPDCRARLASLQKMDEVLRDAVRPSASPAAGGRTEPDEADATAFLARLHQRFDFDEAARGRAREGASAEGWAPEQVAAASLEPTLAREPQALAGERAGARQPIVQVPDVQQPGMQQPGVQTRTAAPASPILRIIRDVGDWFAPAAHRRWFGVATATAAAVVVSVLLIAREPDLPQTALERGLGYSRSTEPGAPPRVTEVPPVQTRDQADATVRSGEPAADSRVDLAPAPGAPSAPAPSADHMVEQPAPEGPPWGSGKSRESQSTPRVVGEEGTSDAHPAAEGMVAASPPAPRGSYMGKDTQGMSKTGAPAGPHGDLRARLTGLLVALQGADALHATRPALTSAREPAEEKQSPSSGTQYLGGRRGSRSPEAAEERPLLSLVLSAEQALRQAPHSLDEDAEAASLEGVDLSEADSRAPTSVSAGAAARRQAADRAPASEKREKSRSYLEQHLATEMLASDLAGESATNRKGEVEAAPPEEEVPVVRAGSSAEDAALAQSRLPAGTSRALAWLTVGDGWFELWRGGSSADGQPVSEDMRADFGMRAIRAYEQAIVADDAAALETPVDTVMDQQGETPAPTDSIVRGGESLEVAAPPAPVSLGAEDRTPTHMGAEERMPARLGADRTPAHLSAQERALIRKRLALLRRVLTDE